MRTSLAESQWHAVADGTIESPDGVTFTRHSSRAKRRVADELVAMGVPLVVFDYGAGRLDWYDPDDAGAVWADTRGSMTSDTPRPQGAVVWTAGIWLSKDGDRLLVLTGHC